MIKKGIIMEIHDQKAIVMSTKGQFDEINATPSMEVGNEIQYGDDSKLKIAATLCMLFIMFGSCLLYTSLNGDIPVFLNNKQKKSAVLADDIIKWCRLEELNLRPTPYHGVALPLS